MEAQRLEQAWCAGGNSPEGFVVEAGVRQGVAEDEAQELGGLSLRNASVIRTPGFPPRERGALHLLCR